MFNVLRLATGAVLAASVAAAPVAARDWNNGGYGGYGNHGGYGYRHHNGIGVGGVLLGAVILGGIAAAASSSRGRYDNRYAYGGVVPQQGYGYGYDNGYAPGGYAYGYGQGSGGYQGGYERRAGADPVDACARAVEREVAQYGERGRISSVDRVDAYDGGSTVRGQVELDRGDTIGFACNANYQGRTSLRLG